MPEKPCKSTTFSPLIVHTGPPPPFGFRFLAAVNGKGAIRAVFRPVGFWNERSAALRASLCLHRAGQTVFQHRILRQYRPAEPFAAKGTGNRLRTGIVEQDAVAAIEIAAGIPYQGVYLPALSRFHAGKRAIQLAFDFL